MPKLKTHSGAKKRFKKLKSGLFKGAHAGRRHLLSKKSSKRKSDMRNKLYACKADMACLELLMPY